MVSESPPERDSMPDILRASSIRSAARFRSLSASLSLSALSDIA